MNRSLLKKLTVALLCLAYLWTGILFAYAETTEPNDDPTPASVATATPAPTATPTVEPTATPSPTPAGSVADHSSSKIEVVANGSILYIADKPEEVSLPDGFVEFTYIYKDNLVWAAENKDSGMILMYLDGTNKEKSGLYAYDKTTEVFTKYISIAASSENYVILQKPDDVAPPEGLIEKQVNLEGEDISVWVSEAYQYLSAETSEYYVVYAMNPQGEKGFYVYDRIEITFQRYGLEGLYDWSPMTKSTAGPMDVENPEPESDDMWTRVWDSIRAYFTRIFTGEADVGDWVVMGVLGFILVLLCIIVVFIIYARRKINEEKSEEVPLEEAASKRKRYRKSQLFQSGFTGQNQSSQQTQTRAQQQPQNGQYGYQQNPYGQQPYQPQYQPNMYGQVPPAQNQWAQPQPQPQTPNMHVNVPQPPVPEKKEPVAEIPNEVTEEPVIEEPVIEEIPAAEEETVITEVPETEEALEVIPEEIPEEVIETAIEPVVEEIPEPEIIEEYEYEPEYQAPEINFGDDFEPLKKSELEFGNFESKQENAPDFGIDFERKEEVTPDFAYSHEEPATPVLSTERPAASEDDKYEYYEETEDALPYDSSIFSDVKNEEKNADLDFKVTQYNDDLNKKAKEFGDDSFK